MFYQNSSWNKLKLHLSDLYFTGSSFSCPSRPFPVAFIVWCSLTQLLSVNWHSLIQYISLRVVPFSQFGDFFGKIILCVFCLYKCYCNTTLLIFSNSSLTFLFVKFLPEIFPFPPWQFPLFILISILLSSISRSFGVCFYPHLQQHVWFHSIIPPAFRFLMKFLMYSLKTVGICSKS